MLWEFTTFARNLRHAIRVYCMIWESTALKICCTVYYFKYVKFDDNPGDSDFYTYVTGERGYQCCYGNIVSISFKVPLCIICVHGIHGGECLASTFPYSKMYAPIGALTFHTYGCLPINFVTRTPRVSLRFGQINKRMSFQKFAAQALIKEEALLQISENIVQILIH